MGRVISPPTEALSSLRPPLETGERRAVDFFREHLRDEWEIYVQPFMNGCRPDIVVLNPRAGIAVFEVKDWNLNALSYESGTSEDDDSLIVTDRGGRQFRKVSPLAQVRRYRREIHDLYCPSLGSEGWPAITGGVIFPYAPGGDVRELLAASSPHPKYEPISGSEDLSAGVLDRVFPEGRRQTSRLMSESIADDLRRWLVEPRHAAAQRVPLRLDAEQRRLAQARTDTGYRRVRGPAGCGKSVVVAARAAELARQRKEVLVVTFNHTLRNYLADLVLRAGGQRNAVTWLSFHEWCKRTMAQAGRQAAYGALWQQADAESVLEVGLAEAVDRALSVGPTRSSVPRFDAILVDEGQDFRAEWWTLLRKVLRPGGEMLLVADRAQDIYGRQRRWTEEAMVGAGFRGEWSELKVAYRSPPQLLRLLERYRRNRLPEAAVDSAPIPGQEELALLELRWRQVDPDDLIIAMCDEVAALFESQQLHSMSDLCVLVDSDALGLELADALMRRNIRTITTIHDDERVSRQLKRAFFGGDARVKLTTIHSFKGWESPLVLVGLRRCSPQVTYTALSRLRRSDSGSRLTVVCADEEEASFGSEWPVFQDDRAGGVDRVSA